MPTPTQNTAMFTGSNISPMPPTTNPSIATDTAAHAAGVLPWLSDIKGLLRAPCPVLAVGHRILVRPRIGRVVPLVDGAPQVDALHLLGLGLARRARGGVVPAPHLGPGRAVPDGGRGPQPGDG